MFFRSINLEYYSFKILLYSVNSFKNLFNWLDIECRFEGNDVSWHNSEMKYMKNNLKFFFHHTRIAVFRSLFQQIDG